MKRLWRQIIRSEQGQALPIVLAVMIIGGLMIAPALNHVSTSLNAGMIVEKNVKGIYAADAGVEGALWYLINELPFPSPHELPDVNQMDVAIETDEIGTYSLYDGELQKIGDHPQNFPGYLAVDKEVWNEGGGTYKYIITVTWQAEPEGPALIHLEEVGVRLPVGYSYQSDSADIEGNLSREEPDDTPDGAGAQMLNWEFPSPRPEVSEAAPTANQTFYVTGTGWPEGDYAWVDGLQPSVGQMGEVIGTLYRITATAPIASPSTTIEAYVLVSSMDYTATGGNFILEAGQVYYGNVNAEENVELYENTILNGNAIAGGNVQLKEAGAIINGNVCAEGDVQLEAVDTVINGNVYAGGNVQLEAVDTVINGNVYAQGNVDLVEGAVINGERDDDYDYDSEGCGLSLTGNRLEILNWEVN